MIDNEKIKTALIAKLKANANIVAKLPSVDEIREVEWQGTTFKYPNIRIRIITNTIFGTAGCYQKVQLGFQVNSEQPSSKEAEEISGIIIEEMNDAAFRQSGVNVVMRATNLVPALRVDTRVWRTESLFTAIIS